MTKLDEIRKRLEAATPGPWAYGPSKLHDGRFYNGYVVGKHPGEKFQIDTEAHVANHGNAELIAHAPSDIALLLSIVERQRSCIEGVLARIQYEAQTCFPINVRELDGSITQERPKSNAGHACDAIRECIAEVDKMVGGKNADE